jgi:triosephosphate isomerase
VCAAIRATVADVAGADAAASVRIQYGGSVKAGTVAELMLGPDVDGALVGGASLDADEFTRIIRLGR